jgi:Urb2/Npa2 family.
MRSTRVKVVHSHPHWLAPLDASHAVHYTRLLTSLCDPSVSAVSRPTQSGPGHEALIDQTKKAKRVAGQYLQYVIMEYAESSLRGALKPEVKAAVTPGLYAALDVMSRDTMRALNAGLDVSGRAVFKGLYDDYVKFGKWNKG